MMMAYELESRVGWAPARKERANELEIENQKEWNTRMFCGSFLRLHLLQLSHTVYLILEIYQL